MSKLDLDKYLAAAEADLDAEARERIRSALGAAVDAAEVEVRARASQAAEGAAESLRGSVRVSSQDMDAQAENAAQKASAARSALLEVVDEANDMPERVQARIKAAQDAAICKVASIADDLRSRIDAEAARAESLSKELEDLKTKSLDLSQARRWTIAMLAATALVALIIILVVSLWGSRIVEQGHVERLEQRATLKAEAEAARAGVENIRLEGVELADLRDQIGADLNRLRAIQEELGIELIRRDDRELELRMGDAVITQELTSRRRLTLGLGDVRLRERVHGPEIQVILDNGLTLAKTSIGSAAHNQEIWWTRNSE